MDNDSLFYNKLKSIHNKIYSSNNEKEISLELNSLYDFIKNKYENLECFKKLDEIINEILNEETLKTKEYTEGFLKKYLNLYFKELKTNIYTSWGLIFLKILIIKNNLHFPLIYSSIFKVYFKYLETNYSTNELSFPIDKEINLYKIMNDCIPIINNLIIDSTSYNLLYLSSLRNKIILFLYDFYKKNKHLNIWFPYSGLGTEPLLFSLLLNLLNEIDSNDTKITNFKIYCSNPDHTLLTDGLIINPLNDLLLKAKSDFAKENNINKKKLNTTIKNSKKNLIIKKNSFLNSEQFIQETFDVLIINSLKLSDIVFSKNEIIKKLNELVDENINVLVIIETKTNEKIDESSFIFDEYKPTTIIDSTLISEKEKDYFLSYLIFQINAQKEQKLKENIHSLKYLRKNFYKMDIKDFKKEILKVDKTTIKTQRDNLTYAFLLAKASLFNKAYEILKKNYSYSYNYSYKILKIIIDNSKNIKMINKIQNFISEKQIKEKGFTAELYDALIDGIEEYEIEEKKYRKKRKWL
jgi:hypothetical protein